jgi:cysteine desulfurase/selenocysteine lyase
MLAWHGFRIAFLTIYFDNAATSYPKPEEVYFACDRALRSGGSSGRGAHSLALAAARLQFESREQIAHFLGLADSSRLVFTSGCTASINLVLNGLRGGGRLKAGDVVLVSAYEHNAVMRPLNALAAELDLTVLTVPPEAGGGLLDIRELAWMLKEHSPVLCVFTRASNVTGRILDLDAIEPLFVSTARSDSSVTKPALLIDAAQSVGVVAEDLSRDFISFWVCSGHKGLLGPPGIGLLYVRQGEVLDPPWRGGTGSRSESYVMPEFYPDRLEPGTSAPFLAAGVAAGVAYLQDFGTDRLWAHDRELSEHFLEGLRKLNKSFGVELIGRSLSGDCLENLPIFALQFAGASPDVVAQRLDCQFDMATRPGLHCALAAHQTLGTVQSGLLRVSFGVSTSEEQVDQLLLALQNICSP